MVFRINIRRVKIPSLVIAVDGKPTADSLQKLKTDLLNEYDRIKNPKINAPSVDDGVVWFSL